MQENTLYDLDLGVTLDVAQYPPHHMTYAKFEAATSKEKMHLQENTLFVLDLSLKVKQNVAQYTLHHATYAPSKFAVATFKNLGDAFTKNM